MLENILIQSSKEFRQILNYIADWRYCDLWEMKEFYLHSFIYYRYSPDDGEWLVFMGLMQEKYLLDILEFLHLEELGREYVLKINNRLAIVEIHANGQLHKHLEQLAENEKLEILEKQSY